MSYYQAGGHAPYPGHQAHTPMAGANGSQPPFQMPPGMPNFNAPVIRMGLPPRDGGQGGFDDRRRGSDMPTGNRNRLGLGADQGSRPHMRETNVQPLTREEVARTLFVTGLVKGTPDDAVLEEVLGAGRGLRRWTRVIDATGKGCEFGFAEYDDAASLDLASKLFEGLSLPLKEDNKCLKDDEGNVKMADVMVIIDPESQKYISQWAAPDADTVQFKFDTAKEDLGVILRNLAQDTANGAPLAQNGLSDFSTPYAEYNGEAIPEQIALQPAAPEDDLSDIPADKREMIASEIAAFRDRSTRRDLDRIKQEQELENAERQRSMGNRMNSLAAPISAPTGPADRTNGVPLGPRDPAPAAGRFRGSQIPKDYVDGVTFVTSAQEDEDDPASDDELERRRRQKLDDALDEVFKTHEETWLTKENAHFASLERQELEAANGQAQQEPRVLELAQYMQDLANKDNATESKCLYYSDHKQWLRHRRRLREEEQRRDARDRQEEQRELRNQRGHSVDTTRSSRREHESREPHNSRRDREQPRVQENRKIGFSMTLNNDEANGEDGKKRATTFLTEDINTLLERPPGLPMADTADPHEQRLRSTLSSDARELLDTLPHTTQTVFDWPIKWEALNDDAIDDEIQPYMDRKIMGILGVQEESLCYNIAEIIRRRGSPGEMQREWAVLGGEAEDLTRLVWLRIIWCSEMAARE